VSGEHTPYPDRRLFDSVPAKDLVGSGETKTGKVSQRVKPLALIFNN